MLPTPAAGSPHQSSPWAPRGQRDGPGGMLDLITASALPLCIVQIIHAHTVIHSKGLFHSSQQNEEIQLQPLTGPAYCYL